MPNRRGDVFGVRRAEGAGRTFSSGTRFATFSGNWGQLVWDGGHPSVAVPEICVFVSLLLFWFSFSFCLGLGSHPRYAVPCRGFTITIRRVCGTLRRIA